ncbi:MAG: hypothetical protein JWN70_3383 [Planctomycetaceae bacterium]|nr:hypothetical protein [Planctomycetaceae bacterium]
MTDLTLKMSFTPRPQRLSCARFIPGPDPAGWLDELSTWGISLETVRLYPIPQSRSGIACAGVLASLEQERELRAERDGVSLLQSQPYGQIAGRLFLPVEAELSVDLRDADWGRLLGQGTTEFVWHPEAGLVAFEQDEILTVMDLLSPRLPGGDPVEPTVDWGLAQPEVTFPNRIGSIRAELPETAAAMLDEGRDGIGTQAKQFKSRPVPVAEQMKSWAQSLLGYALLPVAMFFNALAKLLGGRSPSASSPSTGSPVPGWIGLALVGISLAVIATFIVTALASARISPELIVQALILLVGAALVMALLGPPLISSIGPSAPSSPTLSPSPSSSAGFGLGLQAQMARLMRWTAGLLDSRRREIERLKKLLDEDPDEGLKYALPFGGEASRAGATASGSLMARSVDFKLGAMAFGGLADYWDLPAETQMDLIRRYRELAAREVQLGRYRRAAYIFAELLGDLNSAATTLVNGRYFREAAVLYRDKLHRPLDAARCLEEGGLLAEAIPIYRQHGQLEKVGDLYQRLGEETQAGEAYEAAAEATLLKHDYLDAARLYEHKLQSPDRALESLDAGWPNMPQAKLCLSASFALLSKLGRQDDAIQRIQTLALIPLPESRISDAVGVLAKMSTASPHAQTRSIAADTVRQIASRELLNGAANRLQLTTAVSQLAPEDRLLMRDCQRVHEGRPPKRLESTSAIIRRPVKEMRLIKTFKLPAGVNWLSATSTDRNFYVVGRTQQGVIVARGAWNDPSARVDSLNWKSSLNTTKTLICHAMSERQVLLGSTGHGYFERQVFAASDANPDPEEVLSPPWMPKLIAGLAASSNGVTYTFQPHNLLLSGMDNHGRPTIAETLLISTEGLDADGHPILPMVALNDAVYLAVGPYLIESQSVNRASIREMLEPIAALAISHPNVGRRLAVVGEEAGEFFWSHINSGRRQRFEVGLENPHAAILRSRDLVVHGVGGWKVFVTTDDSIQCLHHIPCDPQQTSFGLLRADMPRQIGLCAADGNVHLYELP